MENELKHPDKVDYFIYQGAMARSERNTKRWVIACGVLFLAFVISNGIWIYRETQFEDVVTETQTVTQDGENGTNTFNGDFYGGDYYGETDSNKNRN